MADYLHVPKDVYPVGRLDKDSEGLLLLTNDTSLNAALLTPSKKHKRSYFAQLEGDINDKSIRQVSEGVQIKLDTGIYHTQSCSVKKLSKPPVLPERNPPIRFRQSIPTSWALIELVEGKNRQVRKMFASVGFPVLRLVRIQIENLKIGKLEPGKHYEIKKEDLLTLLKIDATTLLDKKKKGPYPSKSETLTKTKKVTEKTKIQTTRAADSEKAPKSHKLTTTYGKPSSKKAKGSAPWQKPKKKF